MSLLRLFIIDFMMRCFNWFLENKYPVKAQSYKLILDELSFYWDEW